MSRSQLALQAACALALLSSLPAAAQPMYTSTKIFVSDPAENARFGFDLAIDSGIVAVAANGDDDRGIRSGSGYLFNSTTGARLFKLRASDGRPDDTFGSSIDIHNGLVAVGAKDNDDNGFGSGSAYIFDAATGTELFKLLPNDGNMDDNFGNAVGIDNGLVVVGARFDSDLHNNGGSAYIFDAATGTQLFKLVPPDSSPNNQFGRDVDIADGIAAIGAINLKGKGSVYLFDATTGAFIHKIQGIDTQGGDIFGHAVAIQDGLLAVGAPNHRQNGNDSGAAYIFDVATGDQLSKLLPADGTRNDLFGSSVAIDNNIAVVGAWHDDDTAIDSGSAYFFDALTGDQIAKVFAADPEFNDGFGFSVALHGGTLAIGTISGDDNGFIDSGTTYLMQPGINGPCTPDLVPDLTLDFQDISAFLTAFNSGDLQADFTGDYTLDFFDISEYLKRFQAGCP